MVGRARRNRLMRSEKRRVRRLIERAGVAVLTTIDDHGAPAGRPMLLLLLDDDPRIYLLTHGGSRKVEQIATRPAVSLTLTGPQCHVVIAGEARASRDPDLIRRLWHPTYRAWFPDGREDRDALVLEVIVARVDYWEPPRHRIVRVMQAMRALMTRRAVDTPMKTIDGLF